MSAIAAGGYQYKYYARLSELCQMTSCDRAGVNVDYFKVVLQTAGFTAVAYPHEIPNDEDLLEMLGNGSVDVGWGLQRQELK
ncbi:hypothetical protein PMAYCL1PPCAC_05766 [Pristionchus mayeri]|uniref:Uncharacterized protein n=1 Tax=Pristionchus mayeri TaxID=1317129 RepID=A0AAN5CBV4_9BILA|nr:hypothetical protein PMAYCL1PPCAC_05766 [Pristionchus mayeri]